jgi:hypothetical protein
MNAAPNPVRSLALEPILGGIFRVFEIGAHRLTDLGRLYPRSAIFAYHFVPPRQPHEGSGIFSLSTFPVSGLRVLRSMKQKAERAENREASATRFHVGFTHSIQVQTRMAIAAFAAKIPRTVFYRTYGQTFSQLLPSEQRHFAHAGCVMPNSDDSEELGAELLRLLDKQFEILELSTCVTLTDEEQREYEVRKQRIHELFKQLGTFGAAA